MLSQNGYDADMHGGYTHVVYATDVYEFRTRLLVF
jgi:hypothetical protein